MSYGKPKIKQSSNLTTVPKTMQNQLYNTHPVANKTYKIKEYMEANVSTLNASKKKKKTHLPKSVLLKTH